MKMVFLTGVTGFVGSYTARRFLADGWRVRALVRRPDRPGLLPAGVELVPGALDDPAAYRPALRECHAVIHIAGVVKARTLQEYRAANVDGTRAVAAAAAAECPGAMFVHVSSQSAAGPVRDDDRPVTEADPPRPVSWYGQSKLEGEQALRAAHPGPWCVVRPCIVYGGGDPGLLEMFRAVQTGWVPILAGGRTRVQLVAVEDLARILVAAATRPDLAGRCGFAAADTVTMRELVSEVAALRTPPPRTIPVPAWAVRMAGWYESARQWVTRRARPFNRDKAREILQPGWVCEPAPFLADLGVDPADLTRWRDGIRATCRWYVSAEWLRPAIWAV